MSTTSEGATDEREIARSDRDVGTLRSGSIRSTQRYQRSSRVRAGAGGGMNELAAARPVDGYRRV
jgi:hypothetical protein